MSTCRQAVRARKKARLDPRYRKLKIMDKATSARRQATKVARERDRMLRQYKRKK